jgi:hypothetical protein
LENEPRISRRILEAISIEHSNLVSLREHAIDPLRPRLSLGKKQMNTQNPTQIEYSKSGYRVYRYRMFRGCSYRHFFHDGILEREEYEDNDVPRIRTSFIGFRLVRNK